MMLHIECCPSHLTNVRSFWNEVDTSMLSAALDVVLMFWDDKMKKKSGKSGYFGSVVKINIFILRIDFHLFSKQFTARWLEISHAISRSFVHQY